MQANNISTIDLKKKVKSISLLNLPVDLLIKILVHLDHNSLFCLFKSNTFFAFTHTNDTFWQHNLRQQFSIEDSKQKSSNLNWLKLTNEQPQSDLAPN